MRHRAELQVPHLQFQVSITQDILQIPRTVFHAFLSLHFRYSPVARDNCLLCDRPYHHLDIYADLEPDRDFDIYSMSDDPKICKQEINRVDHGNQEQNAQCFFRSIDSSRFYQAVVRDSMNVKSVGECKLTTSD